VRISQTFLFAASMSAALRILSLLLYQAAIALSPLSVTIPYLSFTPAMLVITAYLLIGERPSPNGLVGVCVVTLGGYLLARSNAHNVAAAKKADADVAGERKDAAATMELGFDVLLTDSTAGAAPVKPRLTGALVRLCLRCASVRNSRAGLDCDLTARRSRRSAACRSWARARAAC